MKKSDEQRWTPEEESFRRGFRHGVRAVLYEGCSEQEALAWVYSNDCTCPPGTSMAGIYMDGLIRQDSSEMLDERM